MTSAPIMEANTISVRAGQATLLKGASISIHSGEVVAIVGPNGAGKSTLLRSLSGDLRPDSGSIRLKQRDLKSYSTRQLASHRFMLSQHVSVGFAFTIDEVVVMGAGDRAHSTVRKTIDDIIDELELGPLRHREMTHLSGGEQQRAHFARVLVQLACGERDHGPGLLLLDEPTSSLDLRHQLTLTDQARRRAQNGTGVVAVVHDLNLACRFADRIVVLRKGEVADDGPPARIITATMLRDIFEVEATVAPGPRGLLTVEPYKTTPPIT